MCKTFWGVVSAAVEQSRRKANMVAQGDGKFGPWGWPQDPSNQKKTYSWQECREPNQPLQFDRWLFLILSLGHSDEFQHSLFSAVPQSDLKVVNKKN